MIKPWDGILDLKFWDNENEWNIFWWWPPQYVFPLGQRMPQVSCVSFVWLQKYGLFCKHPKKNTRKPSNSIKNHQKAKIINIRKKATKLTKIGKRQRSSNIIKIWWDWPTLLGISTHIVKLSWSVKGGELVPVSSLEFTDLVSFGAATGLTLLLEI